MVALTSLCSILFFSWLGHAVKVLFLDPLRGAEHSLVPSVWTVMSITEANWATRNTAFFSSFDAIIIGDPNSPNLSLLNTLVDTRTKWSPAIKGNVIILGTDPSDHRSSSETLMLNGMKFAVSGGGTGLYISLSEYYQHSAPTALKVMSEFGSFRVRGAPNACHDAAHVVGGSVALPPLPDSLLSNWRCSIHEVFEAYPTPFKPYAIASGVTGVGSKKFPDGSAGTPYILARGISNACDTCNPDPRYNLCHITTSCTPTPHGTMCLTRPGFKADSAANDDFTAHWRMKWPGHEHRVAVAPGASSNTECTTGAGPDVCSEVVVVDCSRVALEDGGLGNERYDTDQQVIGEGEL